MSRKSVGKYKIGEPMKTGANVLLLLYVATTVVFILMGSSTQNGQIIDNPVKTLGTAELNYFVTPTVRDGGDCLSWATACVFRTALAKCSGTKSCIINVSGGIHDINNGSDGTGTIISTNYVYVKGQHPVGAVGQESRLVNGHASATKVLTITSNYCTVEGIDFDNSDQTDTGVTFLNVQGNYTVVQDCLFRQAATDPVGTGILYDKGAGSAPISLSINNCRFRRVKDYGISIDNASRLYAKDNQFVNCGTGIYASAATADETYWYNTIFEYNTTAINLATAAAKKHVFSGVHMVGNTNNSAAFGAYAPDITFREVYESDTQRYAYPAGTPGGAASTGYVAITTAGGIQSWAYGAYATLIPINTITRPFRILGFSVHNWNAAQVFRVNLAYGAADPGQTVSLGQWDLSVPNPGTNVVKIAVQASVYVPAYAGVGGRIMTSSGANDELDIALIIEEL
jgi:hypothetical protein